MPRKEYIAWFDMPKSGKLHGQSVLPKQELIRCKDCKHYGDGYFAGCPVRNVKSPNDFCAWAARKEV